MQSDNGTWSVNRIKHEKYFFRTTISKTVVKKIVADLFLQNQN